jgi:L-2-hydroxyglutarate oxidase
MARTLDYSIIGGGIVGLSIAWHLLHRFPRARVAVLEKEREWGLHQTGHNSGVIHSGIYYKPGSSKAAFTRAGSRSLADFCVRHGVPHEICGKLIVATSDAELPLLQRLYERGVENGLAVGLLSGPQVQEIEPHVRARAALHVPGAGIVNYREVALALGELIGYLGGELFLSTEVCSIRPTPAGYALESTRGVFETKCLINCAGLHSDRVARMAGEDPGIAIVPFRGEYYELVPERRHLVKNLIYPIPNPKFPFLGVHFTRMIDGSVHAGPNAVLALKREGYRKTDFAARDVLQIFARPGFWKFGAEHWAEGMKEILRSLSKGTFVRSLQQLIPEMRSEDIVPAGAGVRAQAISREGTLYEDFLILQRPRAVHVCNAPSPAATCSLEIGKAVVSQIPVF